MTTNSITSPPTTTVHAPSANLHHPLLMAPLNGGGMTPSSSHLRHGSEEEESEDKGSEDDEPTVHPQYAHGAPAPYYHHARDEEDKEEEVEEPSMKKSYTRPSSRPRRRRSNRLSRLFISSKQSGKTILPNLETSDLLLLFILQLVPILRPPPPFSPSSTLEPFQAPI